LAGWVGSQSKV